MSAATAVSMGASVEESVSHGVAAGAHTRHSACAAASGPGARASAQAVPSLREPALRGPVESVVVEIRSSRAAGTSDAVSGK